MPSGSKGAGFPNRPTVRPWVLAKADHTKNGENFPQVLTTGGAVRGKRHVRPSKQRRNEHRIALRVLTKLEAVEVSALTEKQKESITWAKGVIDASKAKEASEKATNSAVLTANKVKRIRSPDELMPSKKARGTNVTIDRTLTKPFNEVAKESLVMAVIDRSSEDGSILKDKWSHVQSAVMAHYLAVRREMPGKPPICNDAGWHQGREKLLSFGDARSVDLYKACLSRVGEVWPGVQLEVVEKNNIHSHPRATTWVTEEPSNAADILTVIKDSNPGLPTQNWRISKVGEADGNKRQVNLILNAESTSHIQRASITLQYAFETIVLKVYKQDISPTAECGASTVEVRLSGSAEVPKPNISGDSDCIRKSATSVSEDSSTTSDTEGLRGVSGLFDASDGDIHLDDTNEEFDNTLVGVEVNLSVTNYGKNSTD